MNLSSAKDLQKIVQQAPIGICILDAQTLVAEVVNDKFVAVAGRPYEAIIGKFHWDVFAEVRATYEAALQSVIKTGQSFRADEVEMLLIRHGKEERAVITFVYDPVKEDDGRVTKVAVWVLENTKEVAERQKKEGASLAFRRERDELHRFFMQSPAGICVFGGPNLVYEFVNPLYQAILPGRQLLGRPIFEAVPELVGTSVQEDLLRIYRTGEPYQIHELLVPIAEYEGGPTRDRYFTYNFHARRNEQGEIDGIINFVFEVTTTVTVQNELVAAREYAEQQKRVYETITSGTPDLMYVFGMDYRFTYANNALLAMWGKTWDTAIGKNLLENGYEPWHAEMHEREIDQIKKDKQPIRGEVGFPHATLGRRIYDYILTPVLDENNDVIAVAGVTRDVTDRKRSQDLLTQASEELQTVNEEMAAINEELAASNEELTATNEELASVNQQLIDTRHEKEESENSLRLAIEAANFGTWHIHSVTREFITNARSKELFGYYADEDFSIEQALAQITDEYRGYVSTTLENAIYHGGDYDVTYPVIGLHDQKHRWLRAIGNLKADPSGEFSAFTGVVMDITEQKTDDLRKNDFIGMVSHELKTPLTSLSALVQIANMTLKNSEDDFLSGAMEKANVQVKKMTNMINGFLNISRLESGKMIINKQDFDLEELLHEAIEDARIGLSVNTITLNACGHILINADRDKIGSVISNYISNAVKYAAAASRIEVTCTRQTDTVVVSVKDEGIGIKREDLEKIFDRYYRVDTTYTRHISGFGIGLYLSSEIIQRHGGEVWAESEPGIGSTFYFSLPLGN